MSTGVEMRPTCFANSASTWSSSRPSPRPVAAETATAGGRWRNRRLSNPASPAGRRRRCPTSRARRASSSRPCAPRRRPRDPARRRPRRRRRARARRRPARRPRARASSGSTLDALPLMPLAAKTRRVDEHERRLAALQHGVDRVARRAGDVGDDHALPGRERVQERRLADVRPAEDRDADRLVADDRLVTPGRVTISSRRSPVP